MTETCALCGREQREPALSRSMLHLPAEGLDAERCICRPCAKRVNRAVLEELIDSLWGEGGLWGGRR